MKFSVIIPDRGDRKEFTEHCFFQLDRQTMKPDQVIHVNYRPTTSGVDLVERVQFGISQSKNDKVFIIENDDYYPDDYFEKMQTEIDFVGVISNYYYHLGLLKYRKFTNTTRSALFTTGFNISALRGFKFPKDGLDIALWKHATTSKLLHMVTPIGIKHGHGLCAGGGHKETFKYDHNDKEMDWLKSKVRKESFEFYKQWHTNNK